MVVIMDEDYFEQEFEDELDALKDMEMDDKVSSSAAKRSLFIKSTPKRAPALNDSLPTELEKTPDWRNDESPLDKRKRKDSLSNSTADASPVLVETKKRRVSVPHHDEESVPELWPGHSRVCDPVDTPTTSNVQVTPKPLAVVAKKNRVLRRIPRGEFVAVTGTNGVKSGYMSVANGVGEEENGTAVNSRQVSASSRDLLAVDFETLKRQVEERRMREALDALDQMKEISANVNRDEEIEPAQQTQQNHRLWVDLYSPHLYIDLMSDEAVNRVLLRWVKMWDHVVFKKQKPIKKAVKFDSKPKLPHGGEGKAGNSKQSYKEFMKKKYEDLGLEDEYDKIYRPIQKIVLLCGRPGLGKTTLAHVVARHAGYNVIEMNASDERTAQYFRDKIEDSLTMKPLLGAADPRPNCLIIDEIDGAPAPAINALVSKITDCAGTNDQAKKRKPQASALLRPIICICNDLYTPALRALRQHALVLNFPSQCPSRLATRLLEICRYEDLDTDLSTLMALCRRSSSDIRSCLNTLQFIRRRRGNLTMNDLMTMSVGAKDEQKNLFAFWQQVFQIPSKSRAAMPSVYDEPKEADDAVDDNSISGRFARVYRDSQACGEFNRLVQGLHENFPKMKFKDCFMRSINTGVEWLCFTDQVNRQIFSQQAFNLTGYLHYLSVVFHLNFSQTSLPKITYPKVQFETITKKKHMSSLVSMLCQNIPPVVYQHIGSSVLIQDILPLFVDIIIQPSMRPVNIQLYSAKEKAVLKEMVSSMISYNLTYTQHKTTEGVYAYTLEPPVDELVRFPDIKQARKTLSYTAKQLIANEVQQEKQRRMDAKSSNRNSVSTPSTRASGSFVQATPKRTPTSGTAPKAHTPGGQGGTPTARTPTTGSQRAKTSLDDLLTPNHKQKLMPKNITPSQKGATDFFGRPVDKGSKILSPEALQAQKDTALLHTDIWYKFKEGFSNAVRKKITIADLL